MKTPNRKADDVLDRYFPDETNYVRLGNPKDEIKQSLLKDLLDILDSIEVASFEKRVASEFRAAIKNYFGGEK